MKQDAPEHTLANLHNSAGKTCAHKDSGRVMGYDKMNEQGEQGRVGNSGTYARPC